MYRVIVVFALLPLFLNGQKWQSVGFNLSPSGLELLSQHRVFVDQLFAEGYIGLGNQDIDMYFNDFNAGVRIGVSLLKQVRNQVQISAGFGMYVPNNEYYNLVCTTYGASVHGLHFFGNSSTHGLKLTLGYEYGNKDYFQEYNGEMFSVKVKNRFELKPLAIAIGYVYRL